MSYNLSRDQRDLIVAKLASRFPACFSEEPRHRRPLKKDILADLHAAGFPFTRDETAEGVDWYESNFAYQYALQAGAKRIDLDGREAGTVTPMEQRNAELYVARRKQEAQRDRDLLPAVRTTLALHRAGEVPDDALRKINAPPVATNGARPQDVSLASARVANADDRKKEKRRYTRISPPCPTCGATANAIHSFVEGATLVRTRRCQGEAHHVFLTKEAAVAL
jgi:sRNA-binding protein